MPATLTGGAPTGLNSRNSARTAVSRNGVESRVHAEIGRQLADLGRVQVVRRVEGHHDQALVPQAVRALGQEVAQRGRRRILVRIVVELRKDDPLGRGDGVLDIGARARRRGQQERSRSVKVRLRILAGRDLAGGSGRTGAA